MEKERLEEIALEVAKEREGFIWEEGSYSETGVLEYEVIDFARRFLQRIDAERRKEAVAWVEVIDRHEGPYNFHGKELLDSGKHDLFLSPTIPEGMCIVPINEIQSVKVQGDSAVVIQVTSCRAACEIKARIAASQGERNAD